MNIWQLNISTRRMIILWISDKKRLRRWLKTYIWMRRHVEFQKIPEIDNYHIYWRLHLPMLLKTIKKGPAKKNINNNNTSSIVQIKKRIRTCCLCIQGKWLYKDHHPMQLLEKVIGNNVTSWIQFSFFHFFCQLSLIKLPILNYPDSIFLCIYQ